MRDPETGNWIVLNGEIYNHWAVRQTLSEGGWRSTSDTETVIIERARIFTTGRTAIGALLAPQPQDAKEEAARDNLNTQSKREDRWHDEAQHLAGV